MIKKEVGLKSSVAERLIRILENTINNITAFLRDTCAKVNVFSIKNLSQIVLNKNLSPYQAKHLKSHYSMVAILLPGYTVYEAIFSHNSRNDNLLLNTNDIVSYDFGLQSRCIKESYPKLRKFCYCIDQML